MPKETLAQKRQRTVDILRTLEKAYPDSECSLVFRNPYELLVSVILSAQCTDATVNKVTPALFARYPTPQRLAAAPQKEVERLIRSTGYYTAKARNIRGAAREIVERFEAKVPDTMDDLVTLPGVGRKTANVVLWNAHKKNVGIAVDTHVLRIAHRLRLSSQNTNPAKTEQNLVRLAPQERWGELTHLFIDHGRAICTARAPKCGQCPVFELCPSGPIFISTGIAAPLSPL